MLIPNIQCAICLTFPANVGFFVGGKRLQRAGGGIPIPHQFHWSPPFRWKGGKPIPPDRPVGPLSREKTTPPPFGGPPLHCGEGDYFFTAQNRASSHPMPVQPNTHDATRMRMASALPLSFFAARYAGASIIATSAITATIYLIIKMCSAVTRIFYFPYVALLPSSSSIRNN